MGDHSSRCDLSFFFSMLRVKQKDFAKEHGGVFSNPIPIGVGGKFHIEFR